MKFNWLFIFLVLSCSVSAQQTDQEKQILKQVAEEVEKMESGDLIVKNDSLYNYINSVELKIFGQEIVDKYKIKINIIRDPSFNAFAFPDGHIYIHSGLLCQMDNEAQLATLIGHESIHVINSHSFKEAKDATSKANTFTVLNILTAGLAGGLIGLAGVLSANLSIYGYSRELETEADVMGLDYMIKADYDPHEANKLFQHLIDQVKANKIDEPYFYSTHPKLANRIEKIDGLLKKKYSSVKGGNTFLEQFFGEIEWLIAMNAEMMISANQPLFASKSIDRLLKADSLSGRNWYLKAEMQRKLSQKSESDSVIMFYEKSIQADSTFSPSYKRLGVICYKNKKYDRCILLLEKYLLANPDDKDKKFLQTYIDKSKKELTL